MLSRFLRIKRWSDAANDVDDNAVAFLMADGERVVVVTATAGVHKTAIDEARLRRQLERAAVVDGSLDGRIIEIAADIDPKFSVPLRACRFWIAGARPLDHAGIEGRIESLRVAGNHKHVGIIDTEEVAMLLIKQANATIGCRIPISMPPVVASAGNSAR